MPDNTTVRASASDRLDATTKAAQDIIDREAANRDAKTVRLRTARLAKEDEERKSAKPDHDQETSAGRPS